MTQRTAQNILHRTYCTEHIAQNVLHRNYLQLRNHKSMVIHKLHQRSSLHCTSLYFTSNHFTSLHFTTIYSPFFTSFMRKFSQKPERKINLGTVYIVIGSYNSMRHTKLRLKVDQLQAVPCIRQCYIGLRNIRRIS
jgi:hypothetical protein